MKQVTTPVVQPVQGRVYTGPYVRDTLLQDSSWGGYNTYNYLRAGGWIRITQGRGPIPSTWMYTA